MENIMHINHAHTFQAVNLGESCDLTLEVRGHRWKIPRGRGLAYARQKNRVELSLAHTSVNSAEQVGKAVRMRNPKGDSLAVDSGLPQEVVLLWG